MRDRPLQQAARRSIFSRRPLVRATPSELEAFVDAIEIDPTFSAFVDLCLHRGDNVCVVSDGLDFTVGRVLRRAGLELPFFANRLEYLGDKRWRLTFPHARSDCRALSGNCKCQFAEAAAGQVRIVVGDGRSDFCVAGGADLVLAKGALERHCRDNDIVHFAFSTFGDATRLLTTWLDEQAAGASRSDALRDE